MRAWQPLLLIAAGLGGCGQSCSCSCDGEAPKAPIAAPTAGKATATTAAPAAASTTQASGPTPQGGGAGEGGAIAPDDPTLKRWLDGAKADKSRLLGAKKRLEAAQPIVAAATPAALGAVFPAKFAGFAAQAPAGTGSVNVGTTPLPVASRSYQGPKSAGAPGDIYLKLTDTSAARQMRAPVIAALTETSSIGGYHTRGGFVRGYPAVLTYSAQHRSGKAAVLLGDRYLLEARIEPVSSPEDIATTLGQLDWSRLVPRDAQQK